MESKNIQRYMNTYLGNILYNIRSLLSKQEDIDFIDEMIEKNNSFTPVQNGRRGKDKHPILYLTPYELLIDFRYFMENYEDLLVSNNYKDYIESNYGTNEFYSKHDGECYFLKIIPNEGKNIEKYKNEKKTIRQIRNSDAHGDIEIILDEWTGKISGKSILRFTPSKGSLKEISIQESEFRKILKYLYSRAYNNEDMRDIFLLNKEETHELSAAISNEEELLEFLDKRSILITSFKHDGKKKHEQKIAECLHLTDDRSGCTYNNIDYRIANIITNQDKYEILEISEKDKKAILDFVKSHPRFFKERIDIQRNLIAEVLRTKYLSEEEYNISKTTKRLSLDNETIQYFEGKNNEYFVEDIERQISMLSKIVFLTNKEKLFDSNIDYTKIDISKVDIHRIECERGSNIETQFFRRLRNSFTHYRYRLLESEDKGLDRRIYLWDEDEGGINFEAEMSLKDCISILLEMEFLKEINDKHIEEDDKELSFSGDTEEEFDINEISHNPKQFQYLDIDKRENKKIIEAAIISDRSILLHIGPNIENDREYLKSILIRYPDAIIYLDKYKGDDEFVRIALSADGFLIERVDDKYKLKEEYILLALESSRSSMVLYDIPKKIIFDREFIKKAIMIEPTSIAITSEKNKDDEELAMLAVTGNGMTLKDLSDRLRKDKKIVLAAIRNNLSAKYFALEELQGDPEFCREVEEIENEHKEDLINAEEMEELTQEVKVTDKANADQFMKGTETEKGGNKKGE